MSAASSRQTPDAAGNIDYEDLAPLFAEAVRLSPDDPRRRVLRDRLVTGHLPLARYVASRFRHRRVPEEDLIQVATVGLINAVDRYDPSRGTRFLSFAIPTIMGEVRRYFRDTGWAVRMPRRLQELHLEVSRASFELSQQLGRPPAPSEIAELLGITRDDVYEAIEAGQAYQPLSLERPTSDEPDAALPVDFMGEEDKALEGVVDREALRPLLARLSPLERRILYLRFFRNMSQSQIAGQIGYSQMHVSRMLASTLGKLRRGMAD